MRSPSGVTSALLLFRGLGLAAVFTFWFLPSSASSCVGPTAGRRGGLGRHLRPLQCRLCRCLALLFVRPFNVVKRHVTGDPPTPGREETHSGALPSRVSGTPFRSRGPRGLRGRWGSRVLAALAWPLDAALPLQGVGLGSLPAQVAFAIRVLGQRSCDLRQTCMYMVSV